MGLSIAQYVAVPYLVNVEKVPYLSEKAYGMILAVFRRDDR